MKSHCTTFASDGTALYERYNHVFLAIGTRVGGVDMRDDLAATAWTDLMTVDLNSAKSNWDAWFRQVAYNRMCSAMRRWSPPNVEFVDLPLETLETEVED